MAPKRKSAAKAPAAAQANAPWSHPDTKPLDEITLDWLPQELFHSVEVADKRKYGSVVVSSLCYDTRSTTEAPRVLLWRFIIVKPPKTIHHHTPSALITMRRHSDSDIEMDDEFQGESKWEKNFTRFGNRTFREIAVATAKEDTGFEDFEAVGIKAHAGALSAKARVVLRVVDEVKEPTGTADCHGEKGRWVWRTEEQVERIDEEEFQDLIKGSVLEGFQTLRDAGEKMEGVEETGDAADEGGKEVERNLSPGDRIAFRSTGD